ncbi:LOW QUALITY PROTEIN: Lipase_GDSL domain-containing protein, partial [Cephalotus follicularis]
ILFFGDSTLDTGNNNYIPTIARCNFHPYGKDYPGHTPTGRFSGKVIPDLVASLLGIKQNVPPFLDPNLSDDEIRTGVNFASGSSGYDDLTSDAFHAIPVSQQMNLLKQYISRLSGIVGDEEAKKIIDNSLVIFSAGTNDFVFNFYDSPARRLTFDISGYQDFLLNKLQGFVKNVYDHGFRSMVIAGLPPVGCLPIQMTAKFEFLFRTCVENQNVDAQSYNNKLENLLSQIQAKLAGSKIVYGDVYNPLIDMINNPQKYGFVETKKGCCGTGVVETLFLCNPSTPTCVNASSLWISFYICIASYKINVRNHGYFHSCFIIPLSVYLDKKSNTRKLITMATHSTSFFITLVVLFNISNAINFPNFTNILFFGDSTLDTGNNNYIPTIAKCNFYPYGKDYPGHVPTGRFSNGKLVPDLVASFLGIKQSVPPFLDPNLSDDEIRTGVNFASGSSGYDDLTSDAFHAMPVSQQMNLLKQYISRLSGIVGDEEAKKIVNSSLVIFSAGTNDFVFNFYDSPARRTFDVNGYQDFVLNKLQGFVKNVYDNGFRTMVIAGLPPFGCLPIQITANFEIPFRTCVENQNEDAQSYNKKLENLLSQIEAQLAGSKIIYADLYNPLIDMINNPQKYGFIETNKGCCGTGVVETSILCNLATPTCVNASQYVFWDSIHPTEAVYRYITDKLIANILSKFTG